MNPLKELEKYGQSIWLDYLSRELLRSSDFNQAIVRDGLKGMTSNPSIFEKAISHGEEYDEDIKVYVERGEDVGAIFRHLAVRDIQDSADAFKPVYDATKRGDGFISMEVSPYLAKDTAATIAEARSLWDEVHRENLMIKVPGTEQGIPAIRDLIGRGINVNVTLLFARSMYVKVAEAYLAGLESLDPKADLSRVASVASFFVSRIDTKADAAIDDKLKGNAGTGYDGLAALRGKVAVANAKLAYQQYKTIFSGPRWDRLAARGARPQRLLWASTGTKNKAYSDILYVESLIGADTVNTMPPETMDAYRDHGKPAATLETNLDDARRVLAELEACGISLDRITDELVEDGVQQFSKAADKLYIALAQKRAKLLGGSLLNLRVALGQEAEKIVQDELDIWTDQGNVRRLWAGDASLWTGADEAKWLGWLDIAARERADLAGLRDFAKDVQQQKLSDVVLLGMGGSSLGADVVGLTFGRREGWPALHVLDSTDPDQIRAVQTAICIPTTMFLVSSKSGTTLEPNILKDYFYKLVADERGAEAGKQFAAITDPGSELEKVANQYGFAHQFFGDPAIGGRFSVLSKFGLVAAAAIGLDVKRLLAETQRMVTSCRDMVPPAANPGIRLGVTLGALATKCGRDKITIIASPALASIGAWLEQLIAESTGKLGKGLVPVDGEPLGDPRAYGKDRVFVHVHLAGCEDQVAQFRALEEQGHPVIYITVEDSYQLGQIFFLWEMAIAAAGAVIGINPFDQPDVEASKNKTRELTKQYEANGALPKDAPAFRRDGIAVYGEARDRESLLKARTLDDALRFHFGRIGAGDYFALLAYIENSDAHHAVLQVMRMKIRNSKQVATCLGFGPRYLHSTGQAYKGGPNSGVFLTITCDHSQDLAIPGLKASFGTVEISQALGDFAVLAERGRRALRVHLTDLESGLSALGEAIDRALE
ncbi:MAG: bifunctional transaldolase/phosoglucose isomerase [Rhizomicrobium sp.]|jgi:transaldolase/glucose-6-phosphate isomerase